MAEKMFNDQINEEQEELPPKFNSGDSFAGFEDNKEEFQSFDEN